MIEIRWHGRGGQGAFTAARLLGLAAAVEGGKYALAFPSFGPERRGAPVLGFTKIDDKPIRNRSQIKHCDYILVLDDTLFNDNIFSDLKPGGLVFINTTHSEKFGMDNVIAFDTNELAVKILKKPIVNVAMFAALVAKTGWFAVNQCLNAINKEFKPSLREMNKELFRQTYVLIKEGH